MATAGKRRGRRAPDNPFIRGLAAGTSARQTTNARRFVRGRANRDNYNSIAANAETISPGVTAEARRRGIITGRQRLTGARIAGNSFLRNRLIGQERSTRANRARIQRDAVLAPGVLAANRRARANVRGRGARQRMLDLGVRTGGQRGSNASRSLSALIRGQGQGQPGRAGTRGRGRRRRGRGNRPG